VSRSAAIKATSISKSQITEEFGDNKQKFQFSDPNWYLESNHNILIRQESIEEFVGGKNNIKILDIGCGDGSITKLIEQNISELIVVDSSTEMLKLAESTWINSKIKFTPLKIDIETEQLPDGPFDLILVLGILAHVENHDVLIAEISKRLSPKGVVIIQNFNASHPIGALLLLYGQIRHLFGFQDQDWSKVSNKKITELASRCELEWKDEFSYALPLPGMRRIFSYRSLYTITRKLFGHVKSKKLQWLGFETLMMFQKKS